MAYRRPVPVGILSSFGELIFFAAILSVVLAATLHAQNTPKENPSELTQVVKGSVRDQQTGQPIAGATIVVADTKLGAVSKLDGSFRVEAVPVGRQTILVRSLGFDPFSTITVLTSGRQTILQVELLPSVDYEELEGVTVSGNQGIGPINESALVSATLFSVDDVTRFAGSRDDPARMAGNFSGVFNTDDRRNDIIIRGGSPLELLWRLDGIEIPNPNHFATQGATGGPVNALNANLLANSDFFTGAFPAEYGGKLSGVFDLRTRNGNAEEYELVAQMGFAGFEGMAEGPIPGLDGASFIGSYRRSTLEVFDLLGIDIGFDGVPKYDDVNAKVHLPIDQNNTVDGLLLVGRSDIDLLDSDEEDVFTGDIDVYNGTDLIVVGGTWTQLISEKVVGKFSASSLYSNYRTELDSITTEGENAVTSIDRWYERNSSEAYYSARYRLAWAPSRAHYFTVGAEGRALRYNLSEERFTVRDDDNGQPYRVDEDGTSQQALGFLNWTWRPSPTLTFNTGLFTQYLGVGDQFSVEPRVGASWALAKGQSLSAGVGVHRQMQPLPVYFSYNNQDLDFTQSIHYVLGYSIAPKSDLLVKVEGYYKDISNAPVRANKQDGYSLLNAGTDFGGVRVNFPLKSEGKGRSYGLELSLSKHFTSGWYLLVTGSYIRQEYTGSDGIWRDGGFDNGFIGNLLGGYEWKINDGFSIDMSGKFTWAGGAPYTPIDVERSALYNSTILDDKNYFAERNDTYSRLDLRIDFRQNFDGWSLSSFFSVENALNAENVLARIYDPQTGEVEIENQIEFFPVGGFRVEF